MFRQKFVFAVSLALLAVPCAGVILAQIGRIRIEREEYRVRVVNELGEWVMVGMIGYRSDANLRVSLANGSSWTGNLYGGERVVVAWDRNQNLVFASEVVVDQNGTLRLQAAYPMQADSPAAAGRAELKAAPRKSPLPRMTLEKN